MPYARKGMDVLGIFSQISRIPQMQLEEVFHRFHRFHRCCAGELVSGQPVKHINKNTAQHLWNP